VGRKYANIFYDNVGKKTTEKTVLVAKELVRIE